MSNSCGSQHLEVHTKLTIAKPVHEVFACIVDPEKMSHYFISSGSGFLEEGKTVLWAWEDVGAELPIRVTKVENNKQV